MNTTVINIRTRQPYDVYIGRQCRKYKASLFANPFKISKDGTRDEVLMKYRAWFNDRIKDVSFKAEVEKLRGKRLGCWCKPDPCHGDVIIEYLENMLQRKYHTIDRRSHNPVTKHVNFPNH